MTDDLLARARAEALERHPDVQRTTDGLTYPLDAMRQFQQAAFVAGAEWLLAQLPDREAVARAIDPAIYPDINRLTGDGWAASLRAADAVLDLIRNGAKDDPEPQPSNGPDYHAEHAAWSRRNGATK